MANKPLLSSLLGGQNLGESLKTELSEVLSPLTDQVTRLEKKLDLLLLTLDRIEGLLVSIQPLIRYLNKLPFFK